MEDAWKMRGRRGRRGRWPTSIFSLLGKHSKRLYVREVGRWQILLNKTSSWSKSSFCIPTRTCSRLGWGFLAHPGWGWMRNPTSSQRNYTNHQFITTQITQIRQHKSHPSNPSSHSHWLLNPFHRIHHIHHIQPLPALMGWYSAPLLQCKSSRYDAHCMPSTRPFSSTCLHDCKDLAEGAYLRQPWLWCCLFRESDDSR